MIEPIADALNRQDYLTAQQLIKQGQQTDPDNPWLTFYEACLAEATDDLQQADRLYRSLLPQISNPKLITPIRQGIGRIEQLNRDRQHDKQTERKAILDSLREQSDGNELAVLILEPIDPNQKKAIAPKFAKIMGINPYDAVLSLPTRAWRLYRTGATSELNYITEQMQAEGIACFCMPLSVLAPIQVYSVRYIEAFHPEVIVVYETELGQDARFSFQWTELERQVEANLPLLEKVVTVGRNRKLERKTETIDYAKFCDFHLLKRNVILRFCDQIYEYNIGMTAGMSGEALIGQGTTKNRWEDLKQIFKENLPAIAQWSNPTNFTIFAESAVDFPEMLADISPHVALLRLEETPWDAAFHLYSGLIWYQQSLSPLPPKPVDIATA